MAKFHSCPNCSHKPKGGVFGGAYMNVLKCRDCGRLFCHECGGSSHKCPGCGSTKNSTAGECYA